MGDAAGRVRRGGAMPRRQVARAVQIPGTVRGRGDGAVLQQIPILLTADGNVYFFRPYWAGGWEPYSIWLCIRF